MTRVAAPAHPWGGHLVHLAAGLAVWAISVFGGWLAVEAVGRALGIADEGWFVLVQGTLVATGVAVAYEVWQGRSRTSSRGRTGPFLVGACLGAVLVTAAVGGVWLFGGLTFAVSPDPWEGVARAVGTALLLAAAEEVLFRGVLLRDLETWTGSWLALVVSSLLFGFSHLIGPGAGPGHALLVALEGGVLLGALCLVSDGV